MWIQILRAGIIVLVKAVPSIYPQRDMETEMNTASMDTVNITKRLKRANKENIECLSESESFAPLKKIKTACAVDAKMVRFVRVALLLFAFIKHSVFS